MLYHLRGMRDSSMVNFNWSILDHLPFHKLTRPRPIRDGGLVIRGATLLRSSSIQNRKPPPLGRRLLRGATQLGRI